jgi:NAD(P)-dependent dehydrogenase (short-subunit alcohol dehydrogenase family)
MTTSKAAVVTMSSNLGSIANTQNPMSYPYYAYNASKVALNMVTKCLSLEYQKAWAYGRGWPQNP